jgi:glycerophosphoryl diester phosphodiesterase
MVHVIGHRGLRNEKPENSLIAILEALRLQGIQGVEFDVELTRDKQPVVLHQETVIPNSDFTRLEPAARDFISRDWVIETFAETILNMDAGSWMGSEFAGLKVPALEEILKLPWGQTTAYVELKDATYWGKRDKARPAQIVEAALPYLTAFSGSINVISFNPEILYELHRNAPHIPTTLALWTEWRARINEAIAEAKNCRASIISLPDIVVLGDPDWIKAVHQQAMNIHVYPVSPARGEPEFLKWTASSQIDKWQNLNKLGVDAIISDFARETLNILNPDQAGLTAGF